MQTHRAGGAGGAGDAGGDVDGPTRPGCASPGVWEQWCGWGQVFCGVLKRIFGGLRCLCPCARRGGGGRGAEGQLKVFQVVVLYQSADPSPGMKQGWNSDAIG